MGVDERHGSELLENVCRCDFAALARFVELQAGPKRELLMRACRAVSQAIFRARWADTPRMLAYKLPPDPRLYKPADVSMLRRLLEAGAAGTADEVWNLLAGLDLDDLNAYAYIVDMAPVLAKR